MNFLWNPISVLENIGSADKPNYEKTIRIGQAIVHFNIFLSNDWGPKKETNLLKKLENGKNMVKRMQQNFVCMYIIITYRDAAPFKNRGRGGGGRGGRG